MDTLVIKHPIILHPTYLNTLGLPTKRYALNSWKDQNSVLCPEMIDRLEAIVKGRALINPKKIKLRNRFKKCRRCVQNQTSMQKNKSKIDEKNNKPICSKKSYASKFKSASPVLRNGQSGRFCPGNSSSGLSLAIFNELRELMRLKSAIKTESRDKESVLMNISKEASKWIREIIDEINQKYTENPNAEKQDQRKPRIEKSKKNRNNLVNSQKYISPVPTAGDIFNSKGLVKQKVTEKNEELNMEKAHTSRENCDTEEIKLHSSNKSKIDETSKIIQTKHHLGEKNSRSQEFKTQELSKNICPIMVDSDDTALKLHSDNRNVTENISKIFNTIQCPEIKNSNTTPVEHVSKAKDSKKKYTRTKSKKNDEAGERLEKYKPSCSYHSLSRKTEDTCACYTHIPVMFKKKLTSEITRIGDNMNDNVGDYLILNNIIKKTSKDSLQKKKMQIYDFPSEKCSSVPKKTLHRTKKNIYKNMDLRLHVADIQSSCDNNGCQTYKLPIHLGDISKLCCARCVSWFIYNICNKKNELLNALKRKPSFVAGKF